MGCLVILHQIQEQKPIARRDLEKLTDRAVEHGNAWCL